MDIRSFGKNPYFVVKDNKPMQSKSKYKQWRFEKPFKDYYLRLKSVNNTARERLNAMQNENGYWKRCHIDFLLAIFKWQPNYENYRQRYSKMNIYDPRNPHFVYNIPTFETPSKFHSKKIPASIVKQQKIEAKGLPNIGYIYVRDYKMLFELLLRSHGMAMKRLLKEKKRLFQTKKDFEYLIKATCYTTGLPERKKITGKSKRSFSKLTDEKKSAFAPGFTFVPLEKVKNRAPVPQLKPGATPSSQTPVPKLPRPEEPTLPLASKESEQVETGPEGSDLELVKTGDEGALPLASKESEPDKTGPEGAGIASASMVASVTKETEPEESEPEGASTGRASVVGYSEPGSPKRTNVSRKIVKTPEKKGPPKRAILHINRGRPKRSSSRSNSRRKKRNRQR